MALLCHNYLHLPITTKLQLNNRIVAGLYQYDYREIVERILEALGVGMLSEEAFGATQFGTVVATAPAEAGGTVRGGPRRDAVWHCGHDGTG